VSNNISYNYFSESGLAIDTSKLNSTEADFSSFEPKITEALKQMKELEAGGIANPDENQQVGHYWLRAPELSPSKEISKEISESQKNLIAFSQQVLNEEIKSSANKKFSQLIYIGIGGSALGPQLIIDVFKYKKSDFQIHFIDNADPEGILLLLDSLKNKLPETLVAVVSKSGSTPEPNAGQKICSKYFQNLGLEFNKHALAITVPGSKLDNLAIQENWLIRFPIWPWVGGRYSIFSAVGLLPALLKGLDISEFLNGAKKMDVLTRNTDLFANPASILACAWLENKKRNIQTMVVIPYKDSLLLFSRYLQQLIMESLGKEKNFAGEVVHSGFTVLGNKGSTDQHALVQQLRDGPNDFFVTFIEVLSDFNQQQFSFEDSKLSETVSCGDLLSGFLHGTKSALAETGRSSVMISLDKLNEFSLGALIALYERTVGIYAFVNNINAYNQPGVEAGKIAAEKYLETKSEIVNFILQQSANSTFNVEDMASNIQNQDFSAIFNILRRLAINQNLIEVVSDSNFRTPFETKWKRKSQL
jgi:glucose-6-phosphate isomerase